MSKFKSHKTVEEIARKHRLDISFIQKQLEMGEPIEHEHTKDHTLARDIALQHLDEIPDYYTRLKKMEADAKKHHKKFKDVTEDLRNWFDKDHPEGNWKRFNTKGEPIGPCAREPGEPKPKCLSNEKAKKMTKKEIGAAVERKRAEDPVADREGKGGKPIMSSNKISEQHSNEEERYCPLCDKRETRSECSYGRKAWDKVSVKDHEYSMARSELSTISDALKKLNQTIGKGEGNLEAWVQSKITKAADYLDTAADYVSSGESKIQESCWKEYTNKDMGKKRKRMVPVTESDFVINPEEHKKAQRSAKIRTLVTKGSTEGERKAAENKTTGPLLPKGSISTGVINADYNISLTDKILFEMEAEVLTEKNVPTNPSLWSKMKQKAKQKFDVYPSAYANGWAAKEYKKAGGGWKTANENVTIEDAEGNTFAEVIDIIQPEPIKGFKSQIKEAKRLQSQTGNIILVVLNWRGKYYSLRMFFPQVKLPSRQEINLELDKVYPGCKVVQHTVSDFTPNQPLIQAGFQGGNPGKIGPNKNYVKPMGEEVVLDESTKLDKSKMKCNKPKAQAVGDSLTGKSHVVKACEGGVEKIIRFGQRGVKGSPKKKGESKSYASRRKRFKARHAKNIKKGKMSAAWWSNKIKW